MLGMQQAIALVDRIMVARASSADDGVKHSTDALYFPGGRAVFKAACWAEQDFISWKGLGVVLLCRMSAPRDPIAIFEQSYITWLRTGAVGALAARKLGSFDSSFRAGILGAGKQARAQLCGLLAEFPLLAELHVWSPTPASREAFAAFARERMGSRPVVVHGAAEAVVRNCELLVTVTPSKAPLFSEAALLGGPVRHINALGSDGPGMQELPASLFARANVFADDLDQAMEMGAVNVAVKSGLFGRPDFRGTLAEACAGLVPGPAGRDGRLNIFDCSGIGLFDLPLAMEMHRIASESRADQPSFSF